MGEFVKNRQGVFITVPANACSPNLNVGHPFYFVDSPALASSINNDLFSMLFIIPQLTEVIILQADRNKAFDSIGAVFRKLDSAAPLPIFKIANIDYIAKKEALGYGTCFSGTTKVGKGSLRLEYFLPTNIVDSFKVGKGVVQQ